MLLSLYFLVILHSSPSSLIYASSIYVYLTMSCLLICSLLFYHLSLSRVILTFSPIHSSSLPPPLPSLIPSGAVSGARRYKCPHLSDLHIPAPLLPTLSPSPPSISLLPQPPPPPPSVVTCYCCCC